jgi:hypothetical protein
VNVDEIAPLLDNLTGDLSQLSKIQMENMIVVAKRTGDQFDAARVAKWLVKGDLDELTDSELDELIPLLDEGKSFDIGDFLILKQTENYSVVSTAMYQDLQSSIARLNLEPSIADRAKHVIMGDFSNGGTSYQSGLHNIERAEDLNKDGIIALVKNNEHPNGVIEGSINGKYKSFFPMDWTSDDILNAGQYVFDNHNVVNRYPSGMPDTVIGSFSGVKIQMFLRESGEVSSWFPIV